MESNNLDVFTSSSKEFFIGFGRNGEDAVTLRLFISSIEPGPVSVTIETLRGFSYTGFARNNETLEVVIQAHFKYCTFRTLIEEFE